jgi:hypothetical protein
MRELYSLLNDVTTDLDLYEKENVTDMEIAIMKKKLRATLKKKKNYKSILKVASAVLVISLAGGTLFGSEIIVSAKSIVSQIGAFLGIEKELQDYTTVINTTQTDNGYSITLNEVIVDQGELVVSTTVQSEEQINDNCSALGDVYINGKKVSWASGGGSRPLNNYIVEAVTNFELNELDTQKELEIEIIYNKIRVGGHTEVEGEWKFDFIADGSVLAADTIRIPINSDYQLPNGANIHITEFTRNNLGEKIYFTISDVSGSEFADYDMKLVGEDNLNNEVSFYLSEINGGRGCFVLSDIRNGIDSDATSIILIPYAVKMPEKSGRLSNDFDKAGEEIVIKLNK